MRLLLADLDGTLVETWRETPLPGIPDRLAELRAQAVAVAVVTNQGGVGYRYAHEQHGEWTQAARYPTFQDMQTRLAAIAGTLPIDRLYVSLHHGREDWPIQDDLEIIEFRSPVPIWWTWRPSWRKPAPGMLLQALEDLGAAPSEVLMVGDRNEDKSAADAARVQFRWAAWLTGAPDLQQTLGG